MVASSNLVVSTNNKTYKTISVYINFEIPQCTLRISCCNSPFFSGVSVKTYPFKFYTEVISINNQGRLKTFSLENININFRTENIFKVMQDAINLGFEWSGFYKEDKYFNVEIVNFEIINAIGLINVKVSVKVEANDYYENKEKELKKDLEQYVLNKENKICSNIDHKITSIKF